MTTTNIRNYTTTTNVKNNMTIITRNMINYTPTTNINNDTIININTTTTNPNDKVDPFVQST